MRVMVLMGGRSPEHEISLISGREVVRNLDKKKYNVLPVVISRDGQKWQPKKEVNVQRASATSKIDIVFIAMHGSFGEDGTIQGMLETTGLPYTGSGVLASALGMDKIIFRKLMLVEGLPIPKYIVLRKNDQYKKVFKSLGKPPYFIKPHNQGSSVGAGVVKKKKDVPRALGLAFKYSDKALVDEYIKGTEVTCAVLGNDKPEALPVVEIVPKKSDFFDYESKYAESGSDEIVPARISKALTRKLKEIAVRVHRAVGCRGFSRVDFILKDGKEPIVLEINTIPGLTRMSLFPKAAKAAGYSYSRLLDKVIFYSLQ